MSAMRIPINYDKDHIPVSIQSILISATRNVFDFLVGRSEILYQIGASALKIIDISK